MTLAQWWLIFLRQRACSPRNTSVNSYQIGSKCRSRVYRALFIDLGLTCARPLRASANRRTVATCVCFLGF